MIRRAIRRIHKDQGGFTLIEVLVVMTILGILAAIVSISLLGVTASARAKAAAAELVTVQSAMDAMLADQQVPASGVGGAGPIATACNRGSTKNMAAFPAGLGYTGPDTGSVTVLATHYLRQAATNYSYTCDADGKVTQQ
ncbi:MAG TPA: type II secretion system protein [Candidatus Dormibacteraeota bacterium]|jgi:prepilin-type N-terminal cleavage/methylation domain-containing protein|nr:type II secretion system protein [Candidatus Dormibacteraeota bacterium]